MDRRKALVSWWRELGPFLQRKFWRPLRSMMEIFHVLPLAAVVILFVLLATDGQFREIYIAYLEGPNGDVLAWLAALGSATVILALISAVLREAHLALSSMRINVIYSSYSNPDANSSLHVLQRTAGFGLAFLPWLGVATGLYAARNFVSDRYCQLLNVAKVPASTLKDMQHLLLPGAWAIVVAVIFLGVATTIFSCIDQQYRVAQRAVAFVAPPLAVLLFLLFTDKLDPNLLAFWPIVICIFIVVLTVLYFLGHQWLYRRRTGPILFRSQIDSPDETDINAERNLAVGWARQFRFRVLSPLWSLMAHPEFTTGISLRRRRRQMLVIWAFLPWSLLALYFAIAPSFAPAAQDSDLWAQTATKTPLSLCPIAGTHVPVPGHWTIFPVAICATIGVGLLICFALNRITEKWMWRRVAIIGLVLALMVAARIVSMLGVDTVVSVYRFVGPLGTAALQLLFLISVFALLAWLSQRSGFPALTLVILALVVSVLYPDHVGLTALALGMACLAFAVVAILSDLLPVALVALILPILGIINWHDLQDVPPVNQNPQSEKLSVATAFQSWLKQRGLTTAPSGTAQHPGAGCTGDLQAAAPPAANGNGSKKYPVYIVAAEGGGIYAASAAAVFLSRMQRLCPDFADHVFAISGVSGGAIGAAIFQSLDQASASDTTPPTASHCPGVAEKRDDHTSLSQQVTDVMEDDHFSPVVGSIFSELLGSSTGRAEALVASFEDSVAAHNAAAAAELCAPFANHWSAAAGVPALVLNSTWVETGFRVAFAPFHLHDTDESLYSFSDAGMPDEHDKSLMQAAAVSARFPLILPPFSVVMQDSNLGERKRWNFVDGGYSDNSGATTAFDLYRTLRSVAPSNVDLEMILISSSVPQPQLFGMAINGTVFRDTVAPIDALMKVREDLGNEAVARLCSILYPKDRNSKAQSQSLAGSAGNGNSEALGECVDHAADTQAPLRIIEIQDQTYGLALGWKISRTSFSVVSWMLGQPGQCDRTTLAGQQQGSPSILESTPAESSNDTGPNLTNEIVNRNSCALQSIERSLSG